MIRRVLQLLAGLALIAVLVALVPLLPFPNVPNWFHKDVLPAAPDSLVLFSIDPTYRTEERGNLSPEQAKAERLHGYLLLGKAEITDADGRQSVVRAVNRAIRNAAGTQGARCFNPRHVLRVESGGEAVDVIICFECWRYRVIRGTDDRSEKAGTITPDAQQLLDRVLTEADVPLAPK